MDMSTLEWHGERYNMNITFTIKLKDNIHHKNTHNFISEKNHCHSVVHPTFVKMLNI